LTASGRHPDSTVITSRFHLYPYFRSQRAVIPSSATLNSSPDEQAMNQSIVKEFFDNWSIYDKVLAHNYMYHDDIYRDVQHFITSHYADRPFALFDRNRLAPTPSLPPLPWERVRVMVRNQQLTPSSPPSSPQMGGRGLNGYLRPRLR
jgi:hypothetical protein